MSPSPRLPAMVLCVVSMLVSAPALTAQDSASVSGRAIPSDTTVVPERVLEAVVDSEFVRRGIRVTPAAKDTLISVLRAESTKAAQQGVPTTDVIKRKIYVFGEIREAAAARGTPKYVDLRAVVAAVRDLCRFPKTPPC